MTKKNNKKRRQVKPSSPPTLDKSSDAKSAAKGGFQFAFIPGLVKELPYLTADSLRSYPGLAKVFRQLSLGLVKSTRLKVKQRSKRQAYFTARCTDSWRLMLTLLPDGRLVPFALSPHNYLVTEWKSPQVVEARLARHLEGEVGIIDVTPELLASMDPLGEQVAEPPVDYALDEDLLDLEAIEISHKGHLIVLDHTQDEINRHFHQKAISGDCRTYPLPRALIGPPGTGKTLMMYIWFTHMLLAAKPEERNQFVYLTPHAEGARAQWTAFMQSYPDYDGPNPFVDYAAYLEIERDRLANPGHFTGWFAAQADDTPLSITPSQVYLEFQTLHAIHIQAAFGEKPFHSPIGERAIQKVDSPFLQRAYHEYLTGGSKRSIYASSLEEQEAVFDCYIRYLQFLQDTDLEDPELPSIDTAAMACAKSRRLTLLAVDEIQLYGNTAGHLLGPNVIVTGDPHQERYGGISNLESQIKNLGIMPDQVDTLEVAHRSKANLTRMLRMSIALDEMMSGQGRSRVAYRQVCNAPESIEQKPGSVEWMLLDSEERVRAVGEILAQRPIVLVPNQAKEDELRARFPGDVAIIHIKDFHGDEAPFVVLYGFFDEDEINRANMKAAATIIRSKKLTPESLESMALKASRSKDKAYAKDHSDLMGWSSTSVVALTRAVERMVILSTGKENHTVAALLKAMVEKCQGEFDPKNLRLDESEAVTLISRSIREGRISQAQELYEVMLADRDPTKSWYQQCFPQPAKTSITSEKQSAERHGSIEMPPKYGLSEDATTRIRYLILNSILKSGLYAALSEAWKEIRDLELQAKIDLILGQNEKVPWMSHFINEACQYVSQGAFSTVVDKQKVMHGVFEELIEFLKKHFPKHAIFPRSLSYQDAHSGKSHGLFTFFHYFCLFGVSRNHLAPYFFSGYKSKKPHRIELFNYVQMPPGYAPQRFSEMLACCGVGDQLLSENGYVISYRPQGYDLTYNGPCSLPIPDTGVEKITQIIFLDNQRPFEVLENNPRFFDGVTKEDLTEKTINFVDWRYAIGEITQSNLSSINQEDRTKSNLLYYLTVADGPESYESLILYLMDGNLDEMSKNMRRNAKSIRTVLHNLDYNELYTTTVNLSQSEVEWVTSPVVTLVGTGRLEAVDRLLSKPNNLSGISDDTMMTFCHDLQKVVHSGSVFCREGGVQALANLVSKDSRVLQAFEFPVHEKKINIGPGLVSLILILLRDNFQNDVFYRILKLPYFRAAIKTNFQESAHSLDTLFCLILDKVFLNIRTALTFERTPIEELGIIYDWLELSAQQNFSNWVEHGITGDDFSAHTVITFLFGRHPNRWGFLNNLYLHKDWARKLNGLTEEYLLTLRDTQLLEGKPKSQVRKLPVALLDLLENISSSDALFGVLEKSRLIHDLIVPSSIFRTGYQLDSPHKLLGDHILGQPYTLEAFAVLSKVPKVWAEWMECLYDPKPFAVPSRESLLSVLIVHTLRDKFRACFERNKVILSIIRIMSDPRYLGWINNAPIDMLTKLFFNLPSDAFTVENVAIEFKGRLDFAQRQPLILSYIAYPHGKAFFERLYRDVPAFKQSFDELFSHMISNSQDLHHKLTADRSNYQVIMIVQVLQELGSILRPDMSFTPYSLDMADPMIFSQEPPRFGARRLEESKKEGFDDAAPKAEAVRKGKKAGLLGP